MLFTRWHFTVTWISAKVTLQHGVKFCWTGKRALQAAYENGQALQRDEKHEEAICHYLKFIGKFCDFEINHLVEALLQSLTPDHVRGKD